MKTALLALIVAASALGISAQQPKTVNTQFHLGPVGPGLSATVARFSAIQRAALGGISSAGFFRERISLHVHLGRDHRRWKMDAAMNIDWKTRSDNLNTSDEKDAVNPVLYVLLRIDHGAIEKVRLAPARLHFECRRSASGMAHRRSARGQRGLPRPDRQQTRRRKA